MSSKFKTLLDAQADNFDDLKFYFHHLLSGDCGDDEIIESLNEMSEYGINQKILEPLTSTLKDKSSPLEIGTNDYIDTCGTGGSGLNIFNCSTLSALVVATAGGKVLKHGNKSVTSKSGSADFLERAGINLDHSIELAKEAFEIFNFAFLFAPSFHSSLKYVANARKQINKRTAFNVAGPLAHPGNPKFQIIGTSDKKLNEDIINILKKRKLERAMVVTAEDGVDEISICSKTYVHELKNDEIIQFVLDPEEFDMQLANLNDIQVNTIEEAYVYGLDILNGKRGSGFNMVALNAGAALYTLGINNNLSDGINNAINVLHSGKALLLLNKYAKFTNQ